MSPDEITQSLRVIMSHADTTAEAGLAGLDTSSLLRLHTLTTKLLIRSAPYAAPGKRLESEEKG